jgi:ketosteroid isomerase-like protein
LQSGLEADVGIEAELRAFNASFHAALADNDVEAIVGHFAREARLIVPGRPPVTGHDELRAFFQTDADDPVQIESYTIHEILRDGSLVVEIGSEVFSHRLADGSTSELPMSYVGVYRRDENGRLSLLLDCVSPENPD